MSPRMLHASARVPPCPSPTLASFSPLLPFPGVALFATIRSHARPPLPALPASDPGVRAPSTCASFSGGHGQQHRLPNRACPPPRLPQFLTGLPGISRVLHQSLLSLGRRQPMSPWEPFAEKGGTSSTVRPDCKLQRGPAQCFLGSVVGWALRVR